MSAWTDWVDLAAKLIKDNTQYYVVHGDDDVQRPFVDKHHLRSVWSRLLESRNSVLPDVVIESGDLILYSHPQTCILFASILVSIGWTEWHKFRDLFFDETTACFRRTDADLPLQDIDFLDSSLKDAFLERQYSFLPTYLKEGLIEVSSAHPLPFIEETSLTDPLRPNASSQITKVRVAPGYCLWLPTEDDDQHEPYYLVRKRCHPREHEVMEKLRAHQVAHSRILESFCAIQTGQDFSILLPFADGGDLHHCLHLDSDEERRDAFLNPAADRSMDRRSLILVAAEMLREATHLVSAVDFLHSHQFLGKETFHHMNLKPSNVLIFFGNFPGNIVGRWKVAGFGLSVFQSTHLGASQTTATRCAGTFQPPEVDSDWPYKEGRPRGVSQKGDVWSLGGILCTILAYVLGDSNAVKGLDGDRASINSDAGDDFLYRVDPTTKKPKLKRRIVSWLETVAEGQGDVYWVCGMLHLVNWCLQIQAEDRPSAAELHTRLVDIVAEVVSEHPEVERASWLKEAFIFHGAFYLQGDVPARQRISLWLDEASDLDSIVGRSSISTSTTENQSLSNLRRSGMRLPFFNNSARLSRYMVNQVTAGSDESDLSNPRPRRSLR